MDGPERPIILDPLTGAVLAWRHWLNDQLGQAAAAFPAPLAS